MKNMMLISSSWDERRTFRMIPITKDCAFVEVIFDSTTGFLAIMGSCKKSALQMVPKVDANGDIEMSKTPRKNGKPYKEERRVMEQYQEYYMTNIDEIEGFVEMFAVNADKFNYKEFTRPEPVKESLLVAPDGVPV
jgi:hypothetical protein